MSLAGIWVGSLVSLLVTI